MHSSLWLSRGGVCLSSGFSSSECGSQGHHSPLVGFGACWVVFRTLAALIVKIGVKRVFPLECGGDVLCAQLRAWHVVIWKVQFGGRAGHSDDDGKEGPG